MPRSSVAVIDIVPGNSAPDTCVNLVSTTFFGLIGSVGATSSKLGRGTSTQQSWLSDKFELATSSQHCSGAQQRSPPQATSIEISPERSKQSTIPLTLPQQRITAISEICKPNRYTEVLQGMRVPLPSLQNQVPLPRQFRGYRHQAMMLELSPL